MINKLINKLANSEVEESLANKFRLKRFRYLETLYNALPKPVRILDVGGTIDYWEKMKFTNKKDVLVTLLNIQKENIEYENFCSVIGDARNLSGFNEKEFDIVFSNSVIEHVGTFEDQQKMANEIKRVGKYYYVQTPNYFFPLEPHFFFPFFQMMPLKIKILIMMNFRLGWSDKKILSKEEAVKVATSVRLLKQKELKHLFPDATIIKEKFCGLNKSFIMMSKK
ncbi:MAG: hypothetical protein A2V66_07010 [Ignavibacteria bacterium RBG_13_36_8]|nr:MAG: hypothetical protein A2V66_07010 [Ignavibacteria bacterium RBG_13_36_8]